MHLLIHFQLMQLLPDIHFHWTVILAMVLVMRWLFLKVLVLV